MRRRLGGVSIGLAVAFVVLVLCAHPAAAQTARDSTAIVAIEHQWLGSHDSLTLDHILAPDFQHPVSAGVVLDKASHIAWMVAHPAPPTLHPRFASLNVRIYGDAAVATGIVATTDQSGREVSRNMFTDVFVRRHGRWQAVNAEETPVALSSFRGSASYSP